MARNKSIGEPVNHEKLGELLLKAAGDRSLRQYARDADVAPARLFEMKRANGPRPTIMSLLKLTEGKAAPQNGVTLSDFLSAAGYGNWAVVHLS